MAGKAFCSKGFVRDILPKSKNWEYYFSILAGGLERNPWKITCASMEREARLERAAEELQAEEEQEDSSKNCKRSQSRGNSKQRAREARAARVSRQHAWALACSFTRALCALAQRLEVDIASSFSRARRKAENRERSERNETTGFSFKRFP